VPVLMCDEAGNERGGLGFLGGPGGRVLWALDHPTFDAGGTVVGDDGGVTFLMNQAPSSGPDSGGDGSATRLHLKVAPEHS
jgi:hypothetical protein